jgi:hypothetical protein
MKTGQGGLVAQETALKTLAVETKTPEEEVNRVYKAEIEQLETGAKVRTYIPAIALHRARAELHRARAKRATRTGDAGAETMRRTRRPAS